VQYYHQHYASTIERLFAENGYEIVKPEAQPAAEVADEK
jgi:capsular polysaccharide biosynthesis protein